MPLTDSQTTLLRQVLEQRRRALTEEIRRDAEKARRETYGSLTGPVHDQGDESVADLIADLANAETSRDVAELREIEAARRRLADGGYGICADCGADIGFERLQAAPQAARCIGCQSRHEKTYGEKP